MILPIGIIVPAKSAKHALGLAKYLIRQWDDYHFMFLYKTTECLRVAGVTSDTLVGIEEFEMWGCGDRGFIEKINVNEDNSRGWEYINDQIKSSGNGTGTSLFDGLGFEFAGKGRILDYLLAMGSPCYLVVLEVRA